MDSALAYSTIALRATQVRSPSLRSFSDPVPLSPPIASCLLYTVLSTKKRQKAKNKTNLVIVSEK